MYAIRKRKNSNNSKKNKKRKQRDWQDEEPYESYPDTTSNGNQADADITLTYDDPPISAQEETAAPKANHADVVAGDAEDLPELPSDISALPVMSDKEVTVGSIIAFKHLSLSKATNWQPQISDYKVAKVEKIHDRGTFDLILARRDREVSEKTNVDEDGVRRYSGFEMPEDDHEVEDDGFRSVTFADLLEPKMIQAGDAAEAIDQSQQTPTEEVLKNGNGDDDGTSLSVD